MACEARRRERNLFNASQMPYFFTFHSYLLPLPRAGAETRPYKIVCHSERMRGISCGLHNLCKGEHCSSAGGRRDPPLQGTLWLCSTNFSFVYITPYQGGLFYNFYLIYIDNSLIICYYIAIKNTVGLMPKERMLLCSIIQSQENPTLLMSFTA